MPGAKGYKTREDFLKNCDDICDAAEHVFINDAALDAFSQRLQAPGKGYGWDDYISEEARTDPLDMQRVFFEMAVIVANQSGFIYEGDDGRAHKWEIDGSGAKAMVEKMAELRDAKLVPYLDVKDAAEVDARIGPLFDDVPYKSKRMDIFREFADEAAWDAIGDIVENAKRDDGSYLFDFDTIEALAAAFPAGFGEDPFRKKAALLPMMVAVHARNRGAEVAVTGIPATDYRLPETLHAAGVLEFSDELLAVLESEKGLKEDDPMVAELRAATVRAVEVICDKSGMGVDEVDAALWLSTKNGEMQKFREELEAKHGEGALQKPSKPVNCYTMHF